MYFSIWTGRNFYEFGPLKMRLLKGNRLENSFKKNRAAGAPILGFFGHNPNFGKKGGHPTPPCFKADLAGFGQKGGSDTFNCPDGPKYAIGLLKTLQYQQETL